MNTDATEHDEIFSFYLDLARRTYDGMTDDELHKWQSVCLERYKDEGPTHELAARLEVLNELLADPAGEVAHGFGRVEE